MQFIIDNWIMMVVALTSGGMLLWPSLKNGGGAGLSVDAAVRLMNRERAVVVDIGDAEEFAGGHIFGAKNIPLNQLSERLAGAVKNKTAPLILVCKSGGRSAGAVALARKLGFDKAQSLSGGMKAWLGANLPVEKN